jgi:hypothetical protein
MNVPSSEFQSLSDRLQLLETAVEESAGSRALQFTQTRQQIDEVKKALQTQTNMTAELLELLDSAKHAVKFIVLAGKIAVWLSKVGAALAVIWLAIKGFGLWIFGRHP